MTNGEKLEQVFPNGICPFSKSWLDHEYKEPSTKINQDLTKNKSEISTGSTTKNDLEVDCINRAELLKAMDTWDKFGYTETGCFVREPKGDYVPFVHYEDVVNCVMGMPPVTPLSSGLEKNSQKLEKDFGESDFISRQSVAEYIDYILSHGMGKKKSFAYIKKFVANLTPATPIRPKGHWISHKEHCEMNNLRPSGLGSYFWCSECDCGIDYKYFHLVNYNYCPNCGADMREVVEE